MRRSYLLATVAVAASAAAPPAQAAPLLVLGLIAAGAVGIAAATNQEPGEEEAWDYTDKYGWVGGAPEDVATINAPLAPKPGASRRLVSACRDAVAKNAGRYDVASLEAVSAGKQTRSR